MKIIGIGTVKKEVAMSILTRDGIEAVKSGDITIEELGNMYKLHLVKKASKIGNYPDTFSANYKWIPERVFDKLSPEEIASLVDNFYDCYSAGKNSK